MPPSRTTQCESRWPIPTLRFYVPLGPEVENAGERMTQKGRCIVSTFAIVGWKQNGRAGQGRGWIGVFVGPRNIRYTILSGRYRRRRFIDFIDLPVIRRTLQWAALEPAEFFDGATSNRPASVRRSYRRSRGLYGQRTCICDVYITIAWRIVHFTRVAWREIPSRAAFNLTPR